MQHAVHSHLYNWEGHDDEEYRTSLFIEQPLRKYRKHEHRRCHIYVLLRSLRINRFECEPNTAIHVANILIIDEDRYVSSE